jgi:serine/threonine-protein kinase
LASRAGSQLRVTAQLINAEDGYHLWSERYDRELTDVFAIQDEIAGAIAAKLRIGLAGHHAGAPARSGPKNLEAYELFMKGRVLQTRRGASIMDSVACFERAVELDPDLVEAQAWLADSYRLIAIYGLKPSSEMMPLARTAVERALAGDPDQVEGLATLACIVSVYDWDIAAAKKIWDRALALDPSHVRALAERSINVCLFEDEDRIQALQDARRAAELDALNAWAAGMYAMILGFAGRFDEGLEQARHAVELDAENFMARWALVETLIVAGKHEEGLAAAEPGLRMSGRHPYILTAVAGAHAALGNPDAANAVYQELLGRSHTGYVGFASLAAAAASAHKLDDARDFAARGVKERDGIFVYWRGLPDWAAFRADAACAKILEQAGL